MKKEFTQVVFSACILAFAFSSCKKESAVRATSSLASSFDEIQVSDNFGWSASMQGPLQVVFKNPDHISVENEIVHLIDESSTVLEKGVVHNHALALTLRLPQDAPYYILFPRTGNRFRISGVGHMEVTLTADGTGKKEGHSQSKAANSSCTACSSPFENGTMELPDIGGSTYTIIPETSVPGWETTANDHRIEIWKSGFNGVPAQEGDQFFEINANVSAALYQTLCLDPGSTIKWSVYHRGRAGVDVADVKIGATVATAVKQATMRDGTNAWGYYSGTYVVPQGQTTTVFVFEAVSTASGSNSVGNFLDNFRISCDEDADGVIDQDDDFPKDGSKAYRSFFPTAGKQVLAFEDLWPSMGDFDFNDLVLSNRVVITRNASNELVEASFKVSIDAIGAGIPNGIGLMLYTPNKQAFGTNVIASVSGDATLDPANENGLILCNDVFSILSTYYQNNGVGPTAVPDTLEFTVTFNSNAGSAFIPELYLFRTANRGHEVHFHGYPETATFNTALRNTVDDNGDFKTETGLPWVIEVVTSTQFLNPLEKVDILDAYPQFQQWAVSGGADNTSWYNTPVFSKVFGDQ